MEVLPAGASIDWIASMDGGPADGAGRRLAWKTSARRTAMWQEDFSGFWRVRDAGKAVYLQLKEIRQQANQQLDAAARDAGALMRKSKAGGLVIDLRRCPGGDGSLVPGFVAELGRQGWTRRAGNLAVLTSRQTHSACIMLVSALEQNTRAVFFGQATADRPNHHGETNIIALPRHKFPVLHASEFYQTSDAGDGRLFRTPDWPVPYLNGDYERGHDPVLAAALNHLQDQPK